jgi:hypothetical protein
MTRLSNSKSVACDCSILFVAAIVFLTTKQREKQFFSVLVGCLVGFDRE